ncbi:MAG: hypothetical protein QNL62_03295 [Gammaproteobacteria bacterium]|nr:hypothetical protein [Gammaproteobacteria bacterium]
MINSPVSQSKIKQIVFHFMLFDYIGASRPEKTSSIKQLRGISVTIFPQSDSMNHVSFSLI